MDELDPTPSATSAPVAPAAPDADPSSAAPTVVVTDPPATAEPTPQPTATPTGEPTQPVSTPGATELDGISGQLDTITVALLLIGVLVALAVGLLVVRSMRR